MLSWSILQCFRPSLSYHLSLRPVFCLYLSGSLRQVLLYMGHDARKPDFGGLRTNPSSLIRHLLLAYWKVSYLDLLQAKSNFLASLCSWGDWFESHIVWNPEDRFCHIEAHIITYYIKLDTFKRSGKSIVHVQVYGIWRCIHQFVSKLIL